MHISYLYPAILLSRTHTYILYSIHTCVDSLLHSHFFAVSQSRHPSRFVLHSLFPVCSDRFALILFVFASLALVLSLIPFLSALALVTSSICALSFISLYLFTPLFAFRYSHHMEYIGKAPVTEFGSECSTIVTPMEWSPRIRHATRRTLLSFRFWQVSVPFVPQRSTANTRLIQRDYRQWTVAIAIDSFVLVCGRQLTTDRSSIITA